MDVTVVDDRGQPIRDLTPADFTVRIDGNVRRVVSAEWLSLVTAAKAAAPPPPEGYTSNENATGGRLIVIAVDEPNIRFGAARGVAAAANAFIDRLSPSDRIAAVGLAMNSPATPFTADRDRVKKTIARMNGQRQQIAAMRQYNIALSEAMQIANGDMLTFDTVATRECRNETSQGAQQACRNFVQSEALEIARDAQHNSNETTRALRDLLVGLAAIDAPKTLILMSEGFVIDGSSAEVIELGTLAARARTSLYTLLLDEELYSAVEARISIAPMADRLQRSEGMETLAGASRGTLFRITGTGATVFQRIESELSGYYLLGIEPDPREIRLNAVPLEHYLEQTGQAAVPEAAQVPRGAVVCRV